LVSEFHDKDTDDEVMLETIKSVGGSGKLGMSAVVVVISNKGEYQPAPLELIAAT
jgi:hypothetical protein